jgi:hypothetical protein
MQPLMQADARCKAMTGTGPISFCFGEGLERLGFGWLPWQSGQRDITIVLAICEVFLLIDLPLQQTGQLPSRGRLEDWTPVFE